MIADHGPGEIDLDRPAIARVLDYVLGDGSSFAADRDAAELIMTAAPSYPRWVRANAVFVRHAVRHMLAHGIRQFLDLGAGLGSTRGSVPRLTSDVDARIACVDRDPLIAAHLRVCADPGRTSVHQLDLCAADEVLSGVWRHLDPALPVGVVLTAVLHHEPDGGRVADALRRYHDALAGGSMLAVTHLGPSDADIAALVATHDKLGFPVRPRDRVELRALLGPWQPGHWADHPAVSVLATNNHRKPFCA